ILVKKTMIDSGRCLDPAVRLAVMEHVVGRAAVPASGVRVSHAKKELRERLDTNAKCRRDRQTLGIERIDQSTDAGRNTVVVVEIVAADRLHAAHIEQQG